MLEQGNLSNLTTRLSDAYYPQTGTADFEFVRKEDLTTVREAPIGVGRDCLKIGREPNIIETKMPVMIGNPAAKWLGNCLELFLGPTLLSDERSTGDAKWSITAFLQLQN